MGAATFLQFRFLLPQMTFQKLKQVKALIQHIRLSKLTSVGICEDLDDR